MRPDVGLDSRLRGNDEKGDAPTASPSLRHHRIPEHPNPVDLDLADIARHYVLGMLLGPYLDYLAATQAHDGFRRVRVRCHPDTRGHEFNTMCIA